jgi:hypothetical protein
MDRFSEQTKSCMRALLNCHSLCLGTAMTRFVETPELEKKPQHLRLILDCAAVCSLTADLLAHKSQFHARFCALAAEVCDTAARDCERLGSFQDCARACREAAMHCREMAKLDHAEILELASRLAPGREPESQERLDGYNAGKAH